MSPSQKLSAESFLRLVSAGKVREAYEFYVGAGFRHHNAYFKGDADSLRAGMEENAKAFPEKSIYIKQSLEDGDRVAVHSHVRLKPGDRGHALVHIFRFEGAKIVELWDLGMPIPESSPNENGVF